MRKEAVLWLILWTLGLFLGIFFCLFRLAGLVRVRGLKKNKITPPKGGLLLYFRHPSLIEPVLLFLLFFPWFLFSRKYLPISVPDKRNYYQKWWFGPARPFCVPMNRGRPKEEMLALETIKDLLAAGRTVIFAPGGGRESKGKLFRTATGEVSVFSEAEYLVASEKAKGRIIRRYKNGIDWLRREVGAHFLPVWVGRKGVVFTIIVGEQFALPAGLSSERALEILEGRMLESGER